MVSDPADGKEVRMVEILLWLLKTVAETVIYYGVGKTLDYFFKRR